MSAIVRLYIPLPALYGRLSAPETPSAVYALTRLCAGLEANQHANYNNIDYRNSQHLLISVRYLAPVASIYNEHGSGESVAKYQFGDASQIHCNTAEKIHRAGYCRQRGIARSLPFEKTEHGALKWDEETEEAQEGRVSFAKLACAIFRA